MSERKVDKNFEDWLECLAKGIMIGASLGLFAGLLGFMTMPRGMFLGALVGCLAGIHFKSRRDRMQGK